MRYICRYYWGTRRVWNPLQGGLSRSARSGAHFITTRSARYLKIPQNLAVRVRVSGGGYCLRAGHHRMVEANFHGPRRGDLVKGATGHERNGLWVGATHNERQASRITCRDDAACVLKSGVLSELQSGHQEQSAIRKRGAARHAQTYMHFRRSRQPYTCATAACIR